MAPSSTVIMAVAGPSDLLTALPDDTVQSIIVSAARSDLRVLGRLARCSSRCARAAASVREQCAADSYRRLSPDTFSLLTRGQALQRSLATSAGDSWAPVAERAWVERLRLLHAERRLLASAGVAAVWEHLDVPQRHVLRVAVARRLVGLDAGRRPEAGGGGGDEDDDAYVQVAALIREHVRACGAHGFEAEGLTAQLSHTHPFEASADPALPLALLLSSSPFTRHQAAADFLLAVVGHEDVERAYINLLTVQRPLLPQPVLLRLQREFELTFNSLLKYGLVNH